MAFSKEHARLSSGEAVEARDSDRSSPKLVVERGDEGEEMVERVRGRFVCLD
ncbi:hypothetical protein PYCC9005_005158 [Savitreella phatthalungensis]